jgi:transcriptional regulator with XRE-family HTH domain
MGKRIADLREERGWTQKQLAERAGLSITFLSEVENGKRNVSYGKLLRIADELGTSMDYLARGVQSDPRPRPPVEFPPALSDAAEEQGWSYGETRALLQTRQLVRERRTPKGTESSKEYTKQDWVDLHRRLFEND